MLVGVLHGSCSMGIGISFFQGYTGLSPGLDLESMQETKTLHQDIR